MVHKEKYTTNNHKHETYAKKTKQKTNMHSQRQSR